jgi:hypothetical protein
VRIRGRCLWRPYIASLHAVNRVATAHRGTRQCVNNVLRYLPLIDDLIAGQFNNPIRVIALNVSEGWSRDVSHVAWELLKRVAKDDKPLGGAARRFAEFHLGEAELLRAGIAD